MKGRKVGRLASLSLSELSDMAINKPEIIRSVTINKQKVIPMYVVINNTEIISLVAINKPENI